LFLRTLLVDDRWRDTTGFTPSADHLSLYLDTLSAVDISSCTLCAISEYGMLTASSKQMDMNAGGESSVPDAMWLWLNTLMLTPWQGIRWSFVEARESLGVDVHVVQSIPRSKVFNLLLSWAFFRYEGLHGLPIDQATGVVPAAGSRNAFSIDYIDMDSIAAYTKRLTWNTKTPSNGAYWGDLLFGPGFPAVPTPAESLLTVNHPLSVPHALRQSAAIDGRTYSLTGRRAGHDVERAGNVPAVYIIEGVRSSAGRMVVGY
jgi:hypothetical protein